MDRGLRVLIIEDRRENIIFLANNILKPKGFEVITAMDGETGLRKALEETPDLIITDLKLPRMHGLDILADLKDRGAKIPSIVMTFHGSEETAIKAFRLGAKDYLIKPFNIDDVETALERAWEDISQKRGTGSDNSALQHHIETLEKKVFELEEIMSQGQNQNLQETDSKTLIRLKAQLTEQRQETIKWKQKCVQLTNSLNQQKFLTNEARERARAMLRYIRSNQKKELHPAQQLHNISSG